MKNNVKRYSAFLLVGVILNLGLYYIAHVFHLPLWLDSIGTAFTATALEPAAGLLVAFATNFFQAAVIYDSSSLIYYATSALAALCFGLLLRRRGKLCWKRLPIACLAYLVTASVLTSLFTLWRTAGVPDSGWERQFYEFALAQGVPVYLSCLFGTLVLKLADTAVIAVLLPLFCTLVKPWINQQNPEIVSLKTPFFEPKHKNMK